MASRTQIKIEGYTPQELLQLPEEQIDAFVLSGEPLAFKVGSAELLGQFKIEDETLVVELAHIDGGGEGVLPTIWSLVERYALKKRLAKVRWIVHAVHCAKPNLKLRRLLELKGFTIQSVAGAAEAFTFTSEIKRID